MNHPILTVRITTQGLVLLRTRARQVGELFGLDKTQVTRFVTALSEIARNAVQYAGEGTVTFFLDTGSEEQLEQRLVGEVADKGPGIADLEGILRGRINGRLQVPLGIVGSKRLVDSLDFETPPGGGTVATLAMALPRHARKLSVRDIAGLVEQLGRRKPQSPIEELEQQNRDLMAALDELRGKQLELEVADQRKNHFLATLAHELRNPLGTLHMTLEVMRRQEHMSPSQLAERREVMVRQTAQLTRLVDDLMDASRISLGKVELNLLTTEVNDLTRQALEMTQGAVEAKGHRVSFTPWAAPLQIRADATRLKQVLSNLIHNSARYTPQGGQIDISVRREQAYAVVDVIDNGIGIAAEVLPNVFGLFVQGAPASRDPMEKGGLGVGLTLVQRLVEAHAGTVSAASDGPGKGSRFTVSLPLAASASA